MVCQSACVHSDPSRYCQWSHEHGIIAQIKTFRAIVGSDGPAIMAETSSEKIRMTFGHPDAASGGIAGSRPANAVAAVNFIYLFVNITQYFTVFHSCTNSHDCQMVTFPEPDRSVIHKPMLRGQPHSIDLVRIRHPFCPA